MTGIERMALRTAGPAAAGCRKPLGLAICLTLLALAPLGAQEIRARWQLEAPQAVVGQGLSLDIEVQGVDQFEPPPLAIPGVQVVWQGGSPRNSTSMVSINGKTTTTVRRSFVGSWSLRAARPGRYHLDSLTLDIGGTRVSLPALDWSVGKARESDAYLLRQELLPAATIVGLELDYSLVWYIGQSAQNPEFSIPLLDNPEIELVADLQAGQANQGKDTLTLDYRGNKLQGVKASALYQGKQFTTLTFRLRVRPTASKTYDLADTAVTFQGVVGTRKVRDFFGDLVEEPQYDTLIARAQPASLVVTDLPGAGKPPVFSGLVGKLDLSWSGAAGPYQVGEPIRLVLNLAGVQNKPGLDLDYMLTKAFEGSEFTVTPADDPASPSKGAAVPAEASPGALSRAYVFRARKAGKLTIPPLALNYFDPLTRRYGEARSQALELDIRSSAPPSAGTQPNLVPEPARPGQPSLAGLEVNPPGLVAAPRVPGWLGLLLPGLVSGSILGALGWWRHSRLRARRLIRGRWLHLCAGLEPPAGRPALEEGRRRLAAMTGLLAEAAGLWPAPVHQELSRLVNQEDVVWAEGYFAPGQAARDWHSRWEAFARNVRKFR